MKGKKQDTINVVAKLFLISFIVILASCASNVRHIDTTRPHVPKTKTFLADYSKVWSAVKRALTEEHTLKLMDKESGIMTTEGRPIDGKELSLFQSGLLGKTYKGSYTVNVTKISPNSTDVKINVKLEVEQSFVIFREEKNEAIESYLRKELFDSISKELKL